MSEDLRNIVPDTWAVERLGNFVISEKGKKPKNSSKEKSDKYCLPYVNIQAFEKNIVEEYTDGVGCVLCEEDDFLMVWDGSRSGYIGKAIKGALGSTLVKINFPGIVNDYAYYFLLSKYLQINTRAKGTGTPHVDPDLLWNYQFPIAPYNEQKRVVEKLEELFSDLDKGIETLETGLKQLKVYRQAVLNWAFEGKFTSNWRQINSHLKADSLLNEIQEKRTGELNNRISRGDSEAKRVLGKLKKHKFKEPEMSQIPKMWCWSSFLKACFLVVDCHNKTAPYQDQGIFLIRTTNIRDGRLILDEKIHFVSETTYNRWSKRCPPEPGDILFTREAPMGEAAIIPPNTKVCMGQRTMLLRTFPDLLLPKYLHYAIMDHSFQHRMRGNAIGTGVKHLRVGDVEGLVFPICSVEEQYQVVQEIESRLSVCDKIEELIETALKQSEILRYSILKKTFEGKLVAQDPNDEPASILLERIKAEREHNKPVKKVREKKPRTKTVKTKVA